MKKFHIFLVVEAVFLALAVMTILSEDVPSFLLLLVVTLLVLRYYNIGNKSNFILTISFWVLLLIFMLNPYVVVAILVGLVYVLINYFSQVKHHNKRTLVTFDEKGVRRVIRPNKWIGNQEPFSQTQFAFDDINILRVSGRDTIDLRQVIVSERVNHVIIQKIYGPTEIIVPIDVAVKVNVAAIYGSVTVLDYPKYQLRNETITLEEETYQGAYKQLKIVITILAGDVEVTRQ